MSPAAENSEQPFLPFHRPDLSDAEIAEVIDTLKSGWLTMGPKTAKFEEKFASYVGADHAVAVSSCTAALHLGLESMGLGEGDEVVVTPYTFPSTIASIVYTGATPVLADTAADHPNLCPDSAASKVTDRTKVILPVHFAGHPCDLDALQAVADKAGAVILEDAAHAIPSKHRDRMIGSIGTGTCFSFYAGKNMTTGEGGMFTTNDAKLAEAVKIRRLHGISRDAWKRYTAEGSWYYEVQALGFKYNMTDINAAIGLHQVDRLAGFQKRRMEIVRLYDELLAGVDGFCTPEWPIDGAESSWHLYIIRCLDSLGVSRSDVIEKLRADGIGTSVHFIPAHHHPYFQERFGWTPETSVNATSFYQQAVSLPLFVGMTDDDVRRVADSLKKIAAEAKG